MCQTQEFLQFFRWIIASIWLILSDHCCVEISALDSEIHAPGSTLTEAL